MTLLLLLIATILCTSLSQVLQKRLSLYLLSSNTAVGPHRVNGTGAEAAHESSGVRPSTVTVNSADKLVVAGLLIHSLFWLALGLFVWFIVLSQMEVSRAYPLLSLNLVVVMALSMALFDEPVGRHQIAGASLIIAGVFLLTAGVFG